MIDKNGKLFGKINIIDLLIILVIIAAAVFFVKPFGEGFNFFHRFASLFGKVRPRR